MLACKVSIRQLISPAGLKKNLIPVAVPVKKVAVTLTYWTSPSTGNMGRTNFPRLQSWFDDVVSLTIPGKGVKVGRN